MRKSLIMMVVMLSAFTVQEASAFLSQGCCCECPGIREKSLEFNVGYRRDFIQWRFQDPSIKLHMLGVPVIADKIGRLIRNSNNGPTPPPPSPPQIPFTGERFLDVDDIPGIAVGVAEAALCNNDTYSSRWKDLRMVNVGGTARAVTCDNFYGRFSGNWAYIYDGSYRPKGAFAGEREFISSLISPCGVGSSHCKRLNGHTWDVSGAIGYEICTCDNDLKFMPVIGYSYNHFSVNTPNNRFSDENSTLFNALSVAFKNININTSTSGRSKSSYSCHFTGPYLGFDAFYQFTCSLNLYTTFEYHWASYRAESSIRRSTDVLVEMSSMMGQEKVTSFMELDFAHRSKFNHHACARGLFWDFGADYNYCDCWNLGFKFSWMDWRTHKIGHLHAKVFNESEISFGEMREVFCKDTDLKSTHWGSYRIEFTVGYDF